MQYYYKKIAVSFVLGRFRELLPNIYAKKNYTETNEDEIDFLIEYGKNHYEHFFIFKRSQILPRIRSVLSYLYSLDFSNLLDVGSGRGNFLFPLIDEFKNKEITSIDIDKNRADVFKYINQGGLSNINGIVQDATHLKLKDESFDIVTALEVLEHIPNAKLAFNEILRVAKKQIIISVPSKEDSNPEHIHLLTKDIFTTWMTESNFLKYKFIDLKDHLILIINKQKNV